MTILNYVKIRELLENKNISKMSFYSEIDMTGAGFEKMMDNKRMKVETLEKIAAFFQKPISYFFDEVQQDSERSDYKEKYYDILEKYNKCLEDKEDIRANFSHTSVVSTKPNTTKLDK